MIWGAMKVTTLCQCRGTDKLYTLIKLSEPSDDLILAATTADRKPLPSNLVQLSKDEYVVILADLNINQIITLAQRATHASNPFFESEIQPRAFALASKINGRIKKDLCARIRNIDFSGMDCPNSITCDLLSFTPHGQILVGQISGITQNNCAGIVVLNDRGETISSPNTSLFSASSLTSNLHDYEVKIFRTEEDHGLVVAGVDDSGSFTGGFCCLKEKPMRDLIDKSTEYFMTAFEDPTYCEWIGLRRLNQGQAFEQRMMCSKISSGPTFSIIVPLFNTPLSLFDEMLDSVLDQTYPHWELILINSTPENAALAEHVNERTDEDRRIKLVVLDRNYGITENTNKGIAAASGDYICFFDHDDTIEPDLLYEYYKAINEEPNTAMLYCDEDKLFNKQLVDASFKPDFSIDLLRSNNYLCHMLCISREAYDSVEPQDSSLDGAQDHALALKVAELGGPVKHIAKVLYHWRITPNSTATTSDAKPYASKAGIKAVSQHLSRVGIAANVGLDHQRPFRYRIYHHIPQSLKVSIIVPMLHDVGNVSEYLDGIRATTDFDNFEIVLVGTKKRLKTLGDQSNSASNGPVRLIALSGEPTLSHLMNAGANSAVGNAFIFLKVGYLPAEEQWVDGLVGHILRNDVGVVGTMTCSPNGLIMQAGLSFTDSDIIQLSKYLGYGERGYTGYPVSVRDVSLLGHECIAVSRNVFERYSGFDEKYTTYYSVYDLCFKSLNDGYWNVYTPHSRVISIPMNEASRIEHREDAYSYDDKQRLFKAWHKLIEKGDPFFNHAFSRDPHFAETYKLGKRILR